jgi:serine/threonine-protein kinase
MSNETTLAGAADVGEITVEDLEDGPTLPSVSTDEIPDAIGRYHILSLIGIGGMGRVFKGFDEVIERVVAIKTLHHQESEKEGDIDPLERFKFEAKALGRIYHPGIVNIYDYGTDGDDDFIALEYVEGSPVSYDASTPQFVRIQIILKFLDALDFAHQCGVVHRDLKPTNVLVTNLGEVKITDFGISVIEGALRDGENKFFGTPQYMAPEQIRAKKVNVQTDVFSAGALAYFLLSGERPFDAATPREIVDRVLNDEPTPLTELSSEVTDDLDAVVRCALAKNPAERFQSAADFARALAALNIERPPDRGGKDRLQSRAFTDGEIIFEEGDVGGEAYIVEQGSVDIVKLADGQSFVIGSIGQKGMFGEMSLLDGVPRMASAVARGDVHLSVISVEDLFDVLDGADHVLNSMLAALVSNLRTASDRLVYERSKNRSGDGN